MNRKAHVLYLAFPHVLCLALWPACDVFDASLEARLMEQPASGEALVLGASCTGADAPLVESHETPYTLPVTHLRNTAHECGECAVSARTLALADGFFRVEAQAGQRWHFHLDAAPGQDLALFASPSCDLRECVAFADICGENESEHFTFVAENSSEYVIVMDGVDPTRSETLQILAISPVCGDGKKVHGEVCDDGNLESGDGCDRACRVELSGPQLDEVEPNDDSYLANVLASDFSEPLEILGKVGGGSCQPDYFLFRVAEKALFSAQVRTGAGHACDSAPPLSLKLLAADTAELRGKVLLEGVEKKDGTCPEIRDVMLQPGTFFLRLARTEQSTQFDYNLALDLKPVASP